jgi:hypothetical protein
MCMSLCVRDCVRAGTLLEPAHPPPAPPAPAPGVSVEDFAQLKSMYALLQQQSQQQMQILALQQQMLSAALGVPPMVRHLFESRSQTATLKSFIACFLCMCVDSTKHMEAECLHALKGLALPCESLPWRPVAGSGRLRHACGCDSPFLLLQLPKTSSCSIL